MSASLRPLGQDLLLFQRWWEQYLLLRCLRVREGWVDWVPGYRDHRSGGRLYDAGLLHVLYLLPLLPALQATPPWNSLWHRSPDNHRDGTTACARDGSTATTNRLSPCAANGLPPRAAWLSSTAGWIRPVISWPILGSTTSFVQRGDNLDHLHETSSLQSKLQLRERDDDFLAAPVNAAVKTKLVINDTLFYIRQCIVMCRPLWILLLTVT